MDNTFFFFLLICFGRFRHENYAHMWGHYGSKIVGVFSRPFNQALGLTTNILWWYRLSFMEDYASFAFLKSWALVAPYLCSKFRIFYRLVL